ncbi:MAG TPA: hypothetical protein VKV33_03135 [Streptosporangiaceae bacterium]|jgi:hypothetical protein|nr:hypothetical protein [Streptosporangiaceae bacterium]
MSDPGDSRHVEIKDDGHTVASADVTTVEKDARTAQASLRAASGHIAPGTRTHLVDKVMDLPEVKDSARLEASLPIGDSETLGRLRERCEDVSTRAAGASALLDAEIPDGGPEPG